jgi:hypothetical protein
MGQLVVVNINVLTDTLPPATVRDDGGEGGTVVAMANEQNAMQNENSIFLLII